jgi:segregation and condensation protein A
VDEIQIPEGAAFRIQVGAFEGPLDLLLHLIKKHELNILDLPIAFVTEKYLDYLSMMQELDLDLASEYLLMAATLAHIKSKMLLPQNPLDEVEENEDGYLEDPRAELIRRLLEYQKYRAAAEQLGSRPIAGRDVFGRGSQSEEAQGPAPLAPIDLYKLLDAFGAILKRVKGRVALEVTAEQITIGERISQLSELLRTRKGCTFDELFAKDRTRYEVVVTFLALLEMTKLRITRVYQSDPAAPLHIQYALLDADAPTVPPEEDVAAAYASAPMDLGDGEPDPLEPEFETEVESEAELNDIVEDLPLHASDDHVAAEDSEPPPESELEESDAIETGGLEYDALQGDVSPVDAMAGIFETPAEVEPLPVEPQLAAESEPSPEPEADADLAADSEPSPEPEPESGDEDPAGDRETPV